MPKCWHYFDAVPVDPHQKHFRGIRIFLDTKRQETTRMKRSVCVLAALFALVATGASAQVANLSGSYQCVQGCRAGPGPLAFVTQNGWDLNLVSEAGDSSRAWIDWPGHIWADYWNEGAIYSPDGMTIQFDRGAVWQRYVPPPPPPVRVNRMRAVIVPAR
jgi:hypothetical protein